MNIHNLHFLVHVSITCVQIPNVTRDLASTSAMSRHKQQKQNGFVHPSILPLQIMWNECVSFVYCIYLSLYVLLFCILTIFVYLYDFSTSDCYNLAFMLQDFNKCIHEKHHMQALIPFGM